MKITLEKILLVIAIIASAGLIGFSVALFLIVWSNFL
jgi:hypothetical protein